MSGKPGNDRIPFVSKWPVLARPSVAGFARPVTPHKYVGAAAYAEAKSRPSFSDSTLILLAVVRMIAMTAPSGVGSRLQQVADIDIVISICDSNNAISILIAQSG
jgi:hypothetical protein